MRSASPAPDLTRSAYLCLSLTAVPVARSLVSRDSHSRSPSLKRRRPSPPRSIFASRPIRSYQGSACWGRTAFAAASPMLQVVTNRAYELECALTQTAERDGDALEA